MSFHQDFQHRAILSGPVVTLPTTPVNSNYVFRTPTVTKRTPAFTSTDNTGTNDLSIFTSQPPRGPFPGFDWSTIDGSPNATPGSSQFPALLNGYVKRPPWKVAGVDYAVGIPPGTVLNDPSTISISGVTVNSGTHTVTVGSSAAGATITNIDFGLDGGWHLIISAANITVTKCNFSQGANGLVPLDGDNNNNTNLTITYCYFTVNSTNNTQSTIIGNIRGATIMYCFLENPFQDVIDFGGGSGVAVPFTVKYNLVHADGHQNGHADMIQCGGANYTGTVDFNTWYYEGITGVGSGSQGIGIDAINNNAVVVGSNEIGWNTMRTDTNAQINYLVGALPSVGAGNSFTIHDNYLDMSGSATFAKYAASSQSVYTTNVLMTNGEIFGHTP